MIHRAQQTRYARGAPFCFAERTMALQYEYKTKGTCSRKITIVLEGDTVASVRFDGGCSGNTQGLSALVAGMPVDDVIRRCEGIRCGFKKTSCPDQLARALKEARAGQAK